MKMSRSPYIDNVVLTNKHSGRRTHKVQAFVIHHMAARWTGLRCANYFTFETPREASANYCIGYDGDVALNVEEHNRAWTSSSAWADQRAITYELANSKTGHPWEVSDKTIRKAIVMLAEQHKRYGLKKASYTGDTRGTLWRHDFFIKTNCPGPYLGGKLAYMADEINKILLGNDKNVTPPKNTSGKLFKVQAGAFKDKKNAEALQNTMKKNGIDSFVLQENGLYKVQAGAYSVKKNANDQLAKVKKVANDAFIVETGTAEPTKRKTLNELVEEVYANKHGTGDARKKSLGDRYNEVQNEINRREAAKNKPKAKTLHLPKTASTWRIYKPGGPYVANSSGQLATRLSPAKYGGLSYTIQGNPVAHVYLIDTKDFGRVAIYAHPSTGATIK